MLSKEDKTILDEQNDPIIQLYSPQSYHSSAAIVLNELGRRKLIEALKKNEKQMIIDAFVEDGEGFCLGIFVLPDNEIRKMQDPYLHEWGEEDLIDPRDEIDKKRVHEWEEEQKRNEKTHS